MSFREHLIAYPSIVKLRMIDLRISLGQLLSGCTRLIGIKRLDLSDLPTITVPFVTVQFANLMNYVRCAKILDRTLTYGTSSISMIEPVRPLKVLPAGFVTRLKVLSEMDDMMGSEMALQMVEEARRRLIPRLRPLLVGIGLIALVVMLQDRPSKRAAKKRAETLEEFISKLKATALYTARTPATRRMLADRASAMLRKDYNLDPVTELEWTHIAVQEAMIPDAKEVSSMQNQLNNAPTIWWVHNLVKRGWSSPLEWLMGRSLPAR